MADVTVTSISDEDLATLNSPAPVIADTTITETEAERLADAAAVAEQFAKEQADKKASQNIPEPNLGKANNSPQVVQPADGQRSGLPVTPSTAMGMVAGTTLDRMNNSLSHVCDFSLEVQKNNALRLFLVAQAKNIREGVRAVMKALGFSDSTGQYQWLFDRMKDITRALKWLQKNVIQPILDFQKYVVDYIKKIQEIIAWILTLPAKLLAVLKDCLAKLYKLISNLMTAVASDLSEGGTGETGFSDVVSAAKEAATTALQTANAAATAAAGAVAIATVASAVPNLVSPLKKGV